MRSREDHLVRTFVALADTLVADFHVVDLLQELVEECTALFDATAAGILLQGAEGQLEVIVSTDERSEVIGLMQLRAGQGPCVEAVTSGRVVSVAELDDAADRWPRFAADAHRSGFRAVHAIPLRLREDTIGSLNLFRDSPGALNDDDALAAQALADVATIGILQERVLQESDLARQQLQRALDSRIVIEQAKGYLAHTDGIDMDEAFRRLREHARSTGQRLVDVCAEVVAGRLPL
jgi:transcriptional regulator with GAF, ATPase, and Fis domain